jgi:hypothetical protein
MPVSFCLAPANEPEREVAEALLERTLSGGEVVVGDKGFAGEELEQVVGSLGALFVRPDRRDERARFGSLGGIRQWIESIVGSRVSSRSSVTGDAPSGASSPASLSACSLWPPASGTTVASASRVAASPPMTTNSESSI